MEAVLKNLASTAELLAAAAQTGVVEHWDKQTLSRAFHWAQYCEHLFSRFHDNPPHQLLVGLLNNPNLPTSVMKILFDSSPVDTQHNSSAVGADAEVQGVMLMERLGAVMSQDSEACRAEHFLDSVLQGCEGEAKHFCLVIAAALLTMENAAAETASQDFLLEWLQKKHSVLEHMCSALPTALLMDLAKEHVKFRDAYCDVLKNWASDMEYSINDGEWVQTSTNPTVSFQKLTEHFLALFEACPSLRDDVEKELNALKISDGDFDVRGLSVWGDLLSALNK
uniref:FA complementation group F n=1 Tax=Lates calcarifer TaxID=8187 RepID=A0A4W6D8R4_LATCA